MNSQENSTAAPGTATVSCSVPADVVSKISFDLSRNGGLIDRAAAAKHLSSIVEGKLEHLFGHDHGQHDPDGLTRTITIAELNLETLDWAAGQLATVALDLSRLIDALADDLLPLSDAAYFATKAVPK